MESWKINHLLQRKNFVVDLQTYLRIADSPQMIYGVIMNEKGTKFLFKTSDRYSFLFEVDFNL